MESIYPFIHRKVVVLNEDTRSQDAAKAMRDNRVGCVLVTDARGQITGIVTDRDLASRLAADFEFTTVALSEIMTPDVVTATINTKVADIVHLMETYGIRRIPLLEAGSGGNQKCGGIVTLDDLVASKLVDVHQLSRIVQRQIGRRMVASRERPHSGRAELRSEARTEQVLQRFYDKTPKEPGIEEDRLHGITNYLLGCLAMRLSYTGAANFAAQLPKAIQEYILGLPPGPDRGITAEKLRTELVVRFHLAEENARQFLHKFFSGLNLLVDSGEVEHVKAQLPKDLLELFTPLGGEKKKVA